MAVTVRGATQATENFVTSLVFDKPTGVVEGDALWFVLYLIDTYDTNGASGGAGITPPTGATLVWQSPAGDNGVLVYRLEAGASEPADYTFVITDSFINRWGCIATSPATFGEASDSGSEGGTTWTAPSVTLDADGGALLTIVTNGGEIDPDASQTLRIDFADVGFLVSSEEVASSGATGTRSGSKGFAFSSAYNLALEDSDAPPPAGAGLAAGTSSGTATLRGRGAIAGTAAGTSSARIGAEPVTYKGSTGDAATFVTSIVFDTPAEAEEGDRLIFALMIFGEYAANDEEANITVPSGDYVRHYATDAGASDGMVIYSKVVGPSEPSTHTFTLAAQTTQAIWACAVYSACTVGAIDHATGFLSTWEAPSVTVNNEDSQLLTWTVAQDPIGTGDYQFLRIRQLAALGPTYLQLGDDVPGAGESGLRAGESALASWLAVNMVLEGTAGDQAIEIPKFPLRAGYWTEINPPGVIGTADGRFTQGMAIAPSDPDRIYISMVRLDAADAESGIWRSDDGGATWTQKSGLSPLTPPITCINIKVNPTDPDHLYVSSGVRDASNGFWRSLDGGDTWEQPAGFLSVTPNLDLYHVAVDPDDFDHVLVTYHTAWGGAYGDASGILRSTDGGDTWSIVAPPPGFEDLTGCNVDFLYDPSIPIGSSARWLFAGQNGGRWLTTDSGATWTQVTTRSMDHGGQQLYYAPSGRLFITGLDGPEYSDDNGATWTQFFEDEQTLALAGDGTYVYVLRAAGGTQVKRMPLSSLSTVERVKQKRFLAGAYNGGSFELHYVESTGRLYNASQINGLWVYQFAQPLDASAAGIATATAALQGLQASSEGSAAGSATASATLRGARRGEGAAAGVATAAATLQGAGALEGAAGGAATATGALEGFTALAGTAAGAASPAAAIAGVGALAGSTAGATSVSGALAGSTELAGSAAGAGAASGTLVGQGALQGSSAGTSGAEASFEGASGLAGASDGSATAAATLRGQGALAGSTAGVAAPAAALVGAGSLGGSTAGAATASAELRDASGDALSASSTGSSSAAATLAGRGALAATTAGTSTAQADLGAEASSIAGSAAGAATATAEVAGLGALAGTAAGAGAAAAEITATGRIAGTSQGASGAFWGNGTVRASGAADGIASATATAAAKRLAEGSTAGASTVSGTARARGRLIGLVSCVPETTGELRGRGRMVGLAAAAATALIALNGFSPNPDIPPVYVESPLTPPKPIYFSSRGI